MWKANNCTDSWDINWMFCFLDSLNLVDSVLRKKLLEELQPKTSGIFNGLNSKSRASKQPKFRQTLMRQMIKKTYILNMTY